MSRVPGQTLKSYNSLFRDLVRFRFDLCSLELSDLISVFIYSFLFIPSFFPVMILVLRLRCPCFSACSLRGVVLSFVGCAGFLLVSFDFLLELFFLLEIIVSVDLTLRYPARSVHILFVDRNL